MNIILYNNRAERSAVDKTALLINPIAMSGTLRAECSITNPVIEVQSTGLITSNYVFIEEFNRYYFIDEITSVRNGLWRISMTVDVLMSFKTEILNQRALIHRAKQVGNTDSFTPSLIDNLFPVENYKITKKLTLQYNSTATDYSLPINYLNNQHIYLYFITVANEIILNTGESSPLKFCNIDKKALPTHCNTHIYLIDVTNDITNLSPILNDTEINNYIISMGLVSLNLSLSNGEFTSNNPGRVSIGNKVISLPNLNVIELKSTFNFVDRVINITTRITNDIILRQELMNNDCDILLHLPYVGNIVIDKKYLKQDQPYKYLNLKIYLSFDFTNMCLTYNITHTDNIEYIIHTESVKIGVEIPINRSNLNEVSIRKETNELQAMKGIFGGILSAVGASPKRALSGSLEVFDAAIDWTIADKLNLERGGTTFNSESKISTLSDDNNIYLLLQYAPKQSHIDYETYLNLIGTTFDSYATISTCSGFVVVGSVHLSDITNATSQELTMIETQLKRGIIL